MRAIMKRLGQENCLYIYTEKLENGRKDLGWNEEREDWLVYEKDRPDFCRKALLECNVLMSGIRDFDLFEARAQQHKTTVYSSERWFKPVPSFHGACYIPGWMKLFHPAYFIMANRFRRLLVSKSDNGFFYFPISMNAAHDAAFICSGHGRIDFQRMAGGEVCDRLGNGTIWRKRLRLWGYFVEPSTISAESLRRLREIQSRDIKARQRPLRILWVGRMLALKNVDTIIKAIGIVVNGKAGDTMPVSLTLVGDGPEKQRLMELANGVPVNFHPFVPISQVREIMREHDLYVFASNSFDGWGAVVSEALEEQMPVLASRQSGAGATILPEMCVFDCGNAKELASRILTFDSLPKIDSSLWSAESAADYLLDHFLS